MTNDSRIPAPPRPWSAETKRWWRDFWESEQATKLPPGLRPTVWRLFGWYHRRNLLEKRVDRLFAPPRGKQADKLFVDGSTGQPKVNPLIAELRSIEGQIEALERRVFGAAATAPADPGGASDDPGRLLDAANARFLELVREHELAPADPRLELLEGGEGGTARTA